MRLSELDHAWQALVRSEGTASISALATTVGWSRHPRRRHRACEIVVRDPAIARSTRGYLGGGVQALRQVSLACRIWGTRRRSTSCGGRKPPTRARRVRAGSTSETRPAAGGPDRTRGIRAALACNRGAVELRASPSCRPRLHVAALGRGASAEIHLSCGGVCAFGDVTSCSQRCRRSRAPELGVGHRRRTDRPR